MEKSKNRKEPNTEKSRQCLLVSSSIQIVVLIGFAICYMTFLFNVKFRTICKRFVNKELLFLLGVVFFKILGGEGF